ncbi:MAG: DUF3365 domain-containing protein [Rhodospirillaceae bacterium]|nr:DUF3365 domain-containing protein [Rhodospirillaceae bacterium]
MGLRLKFNLVLLGTFLIGIAIAAGLLLPMIRDNARASVMESARIMMESALAIRGYTASQIRPLLEPLMEDRFLPHSVPSFAAQTNFQALRDRFPEYTYKEPALNPTNLADRATDWEADIIHAFRNDPTLDEISLVRDTPTGQSMVLARPITASSQACLVCHSVPENAPPTMIDMYGSQNGFGWTLGDVIAAQVVSVPMTLPMSRAWTTFASLMGALALVFLLVGVGLNLLLNRVVIRPVVRIARMAEEVSLGRSDVPEYRHKARDEIGILATSFNRMRRSLESAMKLLND